MTVRFSPLRFSLGYLVLSVVALALFAIPLWYGWRANLGTFRAYVPGEEMQRLVEVFHREGAPSAIAAVAAQATKTPPDQVVLFASPSGELLAGNLRAWPAEVPDAPGTYGLVISVGGEASMRVVASHVTLPGGYRLLMGRESVRFESLVERFWYGIAAAIAIVLALGAAFSWLLRRALLSEVDEINRTASAIMQGDLSHRLPVDGGSAELDTLAQTVNGMLVHVARGRDELEGLVAHRTAQLRDSEERYALATTASEEGFWDWIVATDEFYLSPRLLEMYGFPPGTVFARRGDFLLRYPFVPEDRAKWEEALAAHFAGKTARFDIEVRILRKDEVRWIHLTGLAKRNAAGEVVRWTGAAKDVTARKHADALLAGEKQVLELIARGDPQDAALDVICRVFDDLMPGLRSSVTVLDGPSQHLRLAAAPHLPAAFAERMANLPLAGSESGLCGLAVRRAEPVFAQDLAADPAWAGFQELYAAHGLVACWSVPFMSKEGRPLGTFAVFAGQSRDPGAHELAIIEQFGHLASIAIERKRTEGELKRSEERYALAMQASGEGHWDWKIGSDEYYTSPRHLEILGLPPGTTSKGRKEALERIPYHPEDRAKYDAAVAAHFAGKTPRVDIQLRLLVRSELRWVHAIGMCLRDAAGVPVRWAGSITDITEQKRAEAALRQSEERYARAMQASNDGLWEWVPASDEMFVSPRARELFGIADGAVIRTRADVKAHAGIHPEDLPRIEAAIQASRALESGGLDIEYRVVTRPGKVRWIRSRGKVFPDAQGRPALLTGSLTDITERKKAQQALLLSEERYARAMEGSDAGHWDWNIVTDEMFVSPRAREMLALPPGALPARRAEIMALVPQHPDDEQQMDEEVRSGIRSASHERDYRVIPRAGEVRWLRSRGKVYKDARGAAIRMTGSLTDITERKLAADALRASEERYSLAMEASEEGHFDWNVRTDEIFVSGHIKKVFNLPLDADYRTRSELIAQVRYHPQDRAWLEELPRSVLAGSALRHEFEYRILRGEEVRWMGTRWKIFRDAAGSALRVIGVVTDVTAQKHAADELRESEARFRALTELSSDWYWRQDENLRFTYVSHQVADTTAYPREWVIGKTRGELPGITPLSFTWAEHQAALAARQPFRDLEYARVGRDGRAEYVSISGAPIFDSQGSFRGYQGVGHNISERRRFEEELRARQEMLDLAQKSARAVAFEWRIGDGEGQNRWSPDLEAMYGLAPGSYDGTYESWKKLVYPYDWPAVKEAVEHAQRTGDVACEYRVVHPDGSVHWLNAKGRMFFDREAKPVRMVGFMHDVTERRHAEEEFRRMERQLRQAQRLEAMGTLAGGIAHDFNNILGAILGYGEMALRDAAKGSRLRRDLDSIITAGERGRALVDRVLAFSRSGVGERVAVHVEKVVREALDLLSAKLPPNVTLHAKLHAGPAAMLGDATQVHQVLMNLATNAIQAMPAGGTLRVLLDTARIEAARTPTIGAIAAADYLVLQVSDTGTGIAPEITERIFDPFFTTKEVGTGTGLGLSLVHGIVTELGGAIDVASTAGKGSTFTVYLPRSGEAADLDVNEEAAMPRGDGQRVLIVDDEEPLVQLATRTLEELGYAPTGFTSSAAALAAFRADPQRFDALITDERMPGMSGSALIREVREIRGRMPIVMMSGYVGAGVASGAAEVLKKPLSARDLATSLARVLHPSL